MIAAPLALSNIMLLCCCALLLHPLPAAMQRIAEPREVAAAIEWLLGPDASYITGMCCAQQQQKQQTFCLAVPSLSHPGHTHSSCC